jgi:hypothetical protein
MTIGRDEVFGHFVELLSKVRKDRDPDEGVTDRTSLLGDMNWRSIELIALAHVTQEHYRQEFPFNDLLERVANRKPRDLTAGEWVDFIHAHLNRVARPTPALGIMESGSAVG